MPRGIKGDPVTPVASELDHFIRCPTCGQAIDCRELDQVLHHDEPGHRPIPAQ